MAANLESMMFVQHTERDLPWHYAYNPELVALLQQAPTSDEALRIAGLDWEVQSQPLYVTDNPADMGKDPFTYLDISGSGSGLRQVPDFYANVRNTDGAILGVVGSRYKIVQNTDAFSFTDGIIGEGAVYETAGSLNGGKTVWLLAKLDQMQLAGDETDNYLCFANTHDGSGSVKVCVTPIRVVCNNTLNAALSGTKRIFRMRHTTNVDRRIEEAKEVLGLATRYQVELADFAEAMAKKKLEDNQLKAILNSIFDPKGEKPTDLQKRNAEECKQAFYVCYAAPDIAKFVGTAWGAINAMSDLVGHSLPHRNTKTYDEMNWGRIMDGHTLFDQMVDAVK